MHYHWTLRLRYALEYQRELRECGFASRNPELLEFDSHPDRETACVSGYVSLVKYASHPEVFLEPLVRKVTQKNRPWQRASSSLRRKRQRGSRKARI